MKQVLQRGMTLIEVLVALVVIGMAMAAMIKSVDSGVVNTTYLEERSFAHWVAMNRDTELQLNGAGAGIAWQEAEMAGHDWQVRTEVKATNDPFILRAEISVFLNRDDQSPRAQLTSYLVKRP